jgi:hypothetical protein
MFNLMNEWMNAVSVWQKSGYVNICFSCTNGPADDATLHQQVFFPTNFTLCENTLILYHPIKISPRQWHLIIFNWSYEKCCWFHFSGQSHMKVIHHDRVVQCFFRESQSGLRSSRHNSSTRVLRHRHNSSTRVLRQTLRCHITHDNNLK